MGMCGGTAPLILNLTWNSLSSFLTLHQPLPKERVPPVYDASNLSASFDALEKRNISYSC